MEPSGFGHFLTRLLEPSLLAILLGSIVVLTSPLILHYYLYRSAARSSTPSFLLLGPSGSGKTSLITLFARGSPANTHTSQTPLSIEVPLPASITAASTQYRSANDPSVKQLPRLLLVDTPGHSKLRRQALEPLLKPQASSPLSASIRGIIFVVDAADLTSESAGLSEAAEYLYEVLVLLQKRLTSLKTSKGPGTLSILIAANKMDLFTALPAPLAGRALEAEVNRIRSSRAKGLLDSAASADTQDEREWLGEGLDIPFEFGQMREVNVDVSVKGGAILGSGEPDVGEWWDWIGRNM